MFGKCKNCVKAMVRENYAKRRPQYHQYEHSRNQTPARKEMLQREMRRHRAENPDKYRARTAVSNALRDGRLSKKPCQMCGTTDRVQAHHHDYSKPLDVEWLCFACHRKDHGHVVSADVWPTKVP